MSFSLFSSNLVNYLLVDSKFTEQMTHYHCLGISIIILVLLEYGGSVYHKFVSKETRCSIGAFLDFGFAKGTGDLLGCF